MSLLHVTKFKTRHPILKHLIKYYWIITSNNEVVVNHKLLPVHNIDIILNFGSPIKYITENMVEVEAAKVHFNGIRDNCLTINQSGKLDVIGISFFPAGLYPLIKVPLSEFKNKTIDLDTLISVFVSTIEGKIRITDSMIDKMNGIEQELVKIIAAESIPERKMLHMFNDFYTNIGDYTISQLCDQYGINQRQLERYFNKYIGISPKFFQRLSRHQKTMNTMLNNKIIDLTTIACDNNYYDQNHFIKEFKSFTGCTPTLFLNEKKSVKEIIKDNGMSNFYYL